MATGRTTEVLEQASGNVTQRMVEMPRKTERRKDAENVNATWIMGEAPEGSSPASIGRGTEIAGYTVIDVVSENTGEATLLLTEKEETEYILKLYHKNKTPKEELLEILNSVESDYVIHSIAQGTYNGRFYEVLPYYREGDLLARIPITEDTIEKVIIPCINEGLKALHDKEIIHRDIKPSNLFWSEDGERVIIGDFGISSVLNQDVSVRATSMSRTLGYSAPEASNGFISKESDYYSFGITIYHLVLGVDPFAGMSDMQILYQTINKKLELPQTVSYRIQCLIRGLTVKDRTERWGYEEVKRWIDGETVEIQEHTGSTETEKPYNFLSDKFYDLTSLSMAFARNWENAKKHLFRGLVDKYLADFNEELASQCMDYKEMDDKNMAVFKLIYLLNPNAPLCYKGNLYNDMEALGNAMAAKAPEIDTDIAEMIRNGALYQYASENHFEEKLVQKIADVMQTLKKNPKSHQYFTLMYVLHPEMGFKVKQVTCEDLTDLVEYLESEDPDTREKIAGELAENELFLAWVDSLGYGRQVEKWCEIYEKVAW